MPSTVVPNAFDCSVSLPVCAQSVFTTGTEATASCSPVPDTPCSLDSAPSSSVLVIPFNTDSSELTLLVSVCTRCSSVGAPLAPCSPEDPLSPLPPFSPLCPDSPAGPAAFQEIFFSPC